MERRHGNSGLWAAQARALGQATVTAFLPAVAVLAALIPLRSFLQAHLHQVITFRDLMEDPNELYGHSYYGVLSSLGVLLWCAAAVICLFASLLLRRLRRSAEAAGYLLCLGALSAWIALDDLYQIHEHLQLLHIPRLATYGLYATIASAMLIRFRAVAANTPYLIAAVAAVGFAVHSWLDVVRPPENLALWKDFWEDGAKFIGIAGWLAYVSRVAAAPFAPETEAGEAPDHPEPLVDSLASPRGIPDGIR
jgi:hypothetical protein